MTNNNPAWLARMEKGNSAMSPYDAKGIAAEIRELFIYKRAFESMASQMIHPKMSGLEMAKMQLRHRDIDEGE